ncbi:hypothetical protein TMES_18620 [Thalassospira mesophila]|uniref:Uncharacterized protein n=1 Tax=Thalassospira mesophila TaxID=1293891 RepID=A0A1Y2KYI8_9PROT|nr:hypothetical protein TMES_18620 [Thalassospira mesophila]
MMFLVFPCIRPFHRGLPVFYGAGYFYVIRDMFVPRAGVCCDVFNNAQWKKDTPLHAFSKCHIL